MVGLVGVGAWMWVSRDLRSVAVVEVGKLGLLRLGRERGGRCMLRRPCCGRLRGRIGARGRWLGCLVGRRFAFERGERVRLGGWAVPGC